MRRSSTRRGSTCETRSSPGTRWSAATPMAWLMAWTALFITDASAAGNYTAVYYPHDRWSPNWGGETIFYNEQENRVICMRLSKTE